MRRTHQHSVVNMQINTQILLFYVCKCLVFIRMFSDVFYNRRAQCLYVHCITMSLLLPSFLSFFEIAFLVVFTLIGPFQTPTRVLTIDKKLLASSSSSFFLRAHPQPVALSGTAQGETDQI